MIHPRRLEVVGIISARGRGTTLPRKNMYPLLGRPLLWHFLRELRRSSALTRLCVWTEDSEIAALAESLGAVVLQRPDSMVHYGSGFHSSEEWDRSVSQQLIDRFGAVGEVLVHLNCNYVLFSAATLDAMFRTLMNTPSAHIIFPFYEAQQDLYLEHPRATSLFPIWPLAEPDALPKLYRRVGISIDHRYRAERMGVKGRLGHEIAWREGLDFERSADIPFAEYMLSQREPAEATHTERDESSSDPNLPVSATVQDRCSSRVA